MNLDLCYIDLLCCADIIAVIMDNYVMIRAVFASKIVEGFCESNHANSSDTINTITFHDLCHLV